MTNKENEKKIKHFGDASLIWVNLLPNSMARHGLEGYGLGIVHFIQRRVKKATNWDKFDLLRLLVWGGIHCKYQNGSSLLTRKAFRAENRSVIYTCRHILPGAILSTKHLFQLLSSYGHSNKNSINIISNNILWCLLRSVLIDCLEKFFYFINLLRINIFVCIQRPVSTPHFWKPTAFSRWPRVWNPLFFS